MISAPPPPNEKQRLRELYSYCVLDTEPELGFDDLTEIAATICDTPIALVSLIDQNRQWFKSHHGLDVPETPRDVAFCAHAILESVPLVVRDATLDPRFADNPLVTAAPYVQFYAGIPLINPDGFVLGTLCVIDHVPRDLSECQIDMLRRLARQVVNVLELRRTRNDAIHAARAKSDFLATMSHEIRTPLNGVLGMSDLLADTALSPGQQETLNIIKRSGEHLLSVVNDILDFSRLESGRIHLESIAFDMQQLVNDAVAMLSENARAKKLLVQAQWQCKGGASRVGDPHRIQQILINLIGNAIKFTKQGSVTVQVNDSPEVDGIEIVVIDTGIGIDAAVLNKLFDRFTQADSSTTRKFGGTGLGLAITKQLTMLMGGVTTVTSEVGVGSRFSVKIPLVIDHVSAGALAPPTSALELANITGKRILIAEDDATNAILITCILQRFNADLTLVEDGAAAVAACHDKSFDLILMDCMMPEMDGYEAATAVRAMATDWSKTVPIIALTANALPGDRERCLLAGMSDYVSKPIRRAELEAALRRAISKPIHGQQDEISHSAVA